jgi:hypothetical protein
VFVKSHDCLQECYGRVLGHPHRPLQQSAEEFYRSVLKVLQKCRGGVTESRQQTAASSQQRAESREQRADRQADSREMHLASVCLAWSVEEPYREPRIYTESERESEGESVCVCVCVYVCVCVKEPYRKPRIYTESECVCVCVRLCVYVCACVCVCV